MKNKPVIIKIIEQNGFSIKGKTCPRWKICYSVKTFNETYEITVSPLTIKNLIKAIMTDIEYWKYIGIGEVKNLKEEKEITKIIDKLKKVIKQVGEIK